MILKDAGHDSLEKRAIVGIHGGHQSGQCPRAPGSELVSGPAASGLAELAVGRTVRAEGGDLVGPAVGAAAGSLGGLVV